MMNTVAVATVHSATRDDVWDALVNPERLQRWFGAVTRSDGDEQSYRIAVTGTGEDVQARVVTCIAECRLALEWVADGGEPSTVTVTLGDTASGTAVILQEEGVSPTMITAYQRGWRAHLMRLEASLEGWPMPEWTDLAQG